MLLNNHLTIMNKTTKPLLRMKKKRRRLGPLFKNNNKEGLCSVFSECQERSFYFVRYDLNTHLKLDQKAEHTISSDLRTMYIHRLNLR